MLSPHSQISMKDCRLGDAPLHACCFRTTCHCFLNLLVFKKVSLSLQGIESLQRYRLPSVLHNMRIRATQAPSARTAMQGSTVCHLCSGTSHTTFLKRAYLPVFVLCLSRGNGQPNGQMKWQRWQSRRQNWQIKSCSTLSYAVPVKGQWPE